MSNCQIFWLQDKIVFVLQPGMDNIKLLEQKLRSQYCISETLFSGVNEWASEYESKSLAFKHTCHIWPITHNLHYQKIWCIHNASFRSPSSFSSTVDVLFFMKKKYLTSDRCLIQC